MGSMDQAMHPAVVNRFARIEVRSPFGALVRDQWSYV